MNVGEEKDTKNVPEKKEMVNTSKVNDVVNATVMAQIISSSCPDMHLFMGSRLPWHIYILCTDGK